MSAYLLPYGIKNLEFSLPTGMSADVYSPENFPAAPSQIKAVEIALENGFGEFDFNQFRSAKTVAIAINDKTRPVPHDQLLPPLISKLTTLGIPPDGIHFLIASGTHLPMQPGDYQSILPREIWQNFSIISHDCDNYDQLIFLGNTTQNTPVWINKQFYAAELKIVIGNIEPHHFMGFSGGVKSAAIGLAGRQTINTNHAMLVHPDARTGVYTKNPMRQDIEEIGERIGVHFALNAILNADKQIVSVIAGSPKAVMNTGITLCEDICQVKISSSYDLVIASPGGYPKDINFYQAQKGLTHAAMMTKDGGTVILVSACQDGIGSVPYQEWMKGMNSHAEVFQRFQNEGFRVGPHKAYQVAKIASRINVVLVSEILAENVEQLLIHAAPDLQTAVANALKELPSNGKIAVLPRAVATIPVLY